MSIDSIESILSYFTHPDTFTEDTDSQEGEELIVEGDQNGNWDFSLYLQVF